jgi:hypothetical protein
MTLIADHLRRGNIDFAAVNRAALTYLPSLVRVWLPNGRRQVMNGCAVIRLGRTEARALSAST